MYFVQPRLLPDVFIFYKNESERKKMKKIITTLCTLAMSLSLFGCTAGLTDNPNYNASASTEDTSKEKTVLRIGMECDYAPKQLAGRYRNRYKSSNF